MLRYLMMYPLGGLTIALLIKISQIKVDSDFKFAFIVFILGISIGPFVAAICCLNDVEKHHARLKEVREAQYYYFMKDQEKLTQYLDALSKSDAQEEIRILRRNKFNSRGIE